jgi:hypothetical protein
VKQPSLKYRSGAKPEQQASRKNTVQPKLKVTEPGDKYEQEAEAMAEKVVRKKKEEPETGIIARAVQSQKPATASNDNPDETKLLMRKAEAGAGIHVSSGMASQLSQTQHTGASLPDSTKSFMESAFNRDFSGVKIHTDQKASSMNEEINAKAFTHGNHIYFNTGQFSPGSPEGKHLLAHELTHVVQQNETATTPDVSRSIELKPAKGKNSAHDRANELINKMNQQSPAQQYYLDGDKIKYTVKDATALSPFDKKMQAFIDEAPNIPMLLINKDRKVGGAPLFVDSFRLGFVDLDDMLACTDLSFQMNLIHLLAERFNVPDYEKKIPKPSLDARLPASHRVGFDAEAEHLRNLIGDPTIKFVYEDARASGADVFGFRSKEGYYIFHVFSRDKKGIRGGSLYVHTKDKRRISVDELIKERKAAAKPAMPKLANAPLNNRFESQANAMADRIVKTPPKGKGAATLPGTQTVMRKSAGAGGFHPTASFASKLSAAKGGGAPLPAQPKRFMENAFGASFSQVRIHTDETAVALSDEINAQAFTWGSDIFFNQGLFAPASLTGTRLLAHELTHVLQQTGTEIISRNKSDKPLTKKDEPKPIEGPLVVGGYTIDFDSKYLTIPGLSLPDFKFRNSPKIKTPILSTTTKQYDPKNKPGKGKRIKTNQVGNWKEKVRTKVKDQVTGLLGKIDKNTEGFYFLAGKPKKSTVRIIGMPDDIVEACLIPTWDRDGNTNNHQVDHIEELQLGGADTIENYELLDASANESSGGLIFHERKKQTNQAITKLQTGLAKWNANKPKEKQKQLPKADELLADYITTFTKVIDWTLGKDNRISKRGNTHYWKLTEIEAGEHLNVLRSMTPKEIKALEGTPTILKIALRNAFSRAPEEVPVKIDNPKCLVAGLWITEVEYIEPEPADNTNKNTEKWLAILKGDLFRKQRKHVSMSYVEIPVYKVPGIHFFGFLKGRFEDWITKPPEAAAFSPIDIHEMDIDVNKKSVSLTGKILPEIPLLEKLDIDIDMDGDSLIISKTFSVEDLKGKVPSLLELTSGTLTVYADLAANPSLGITGQLDFTIKNLGTGFIKGNGSTSGEFELGFGFNFDKGLFDESSISGGYKKRDGADKPAFYLKGHALKNTKNSKLFKSARVDVSYENGIFTAIGEAETRLGVVNKGTIQVVTGNGETSLVADFILGDKLPGIQSGDLHFLFRKKEDGTYAIDASATVVTKFKSIPSVTLHGFYDSNGLFRFEGDAVINTKRFKGKIHFGITNEDVDKDGKLTGKPGTELRPFGDGNIQFILTDWLTGGIDAKITPDARIELGGTLKPDPHLRIANLLDPIDKKFGRFSIPEFSIFGIPHIADIFIGVSGGLYFTANIGPLFLNNAFLKFDHLYIDAPEQTTVTGGGSLDIPVSAEAGLEATITAGGRILVVKASINLTGSIGFAIIGNAGVAVAFSWSMAKGFSLDKAIAYLKARTELVGRLGGTFKIDLDLLLTTINLYEKNLFKKEKRWPLGLDLDLNFPLVFNKETGSLNPPKPEEVKDPKPEVDEDKVRKTATEEPPANEPAPGKEEALAKVRTLPAVATLGSNWLTNKFERYNYIKNLKVKYPNISWTYLDDEAKMLDERAFEGLRSKLLSKDSFPVSPFGIKLRLLALEEFQETRLYESPTAAKELRYRIERLGEEPEVPVVEPTQAAQPTQTEQPAPPAIPESTPIQNNSTT